MGDLGKKVLGIVAGITASIFTALPCFAQDTLDTKSSNQYLKLGVSSISWSDHSLKNYENTIFFHGGTEHQIIKTLYLGWNVIIGSKKERNPEEPKKINYFSTNLELSLGTDKNKEVSIYGLFGIGTASLNEKNNLGEIKTEDSAFGSYFGVGLNIEVTKNVYLFAELKENLGKVKFYGEPLSIKGLMGGGGMKIGF